MKKQIRTILSNYTYDYHNICPIELCEYEGNIPDWYILYKGCKTKEYGDKLVNYYFYMMNEFHERIPFEWEKKIVINRYNKFKENFEKFKEIYDK